jgi:hypothetical protein
MQPKTFVLRLKFMMLCQASLSCCSKLLWRYVFELFKGDLAPSDSKELITHLSEDITSKLNLALKDVFKQYLS